ncbi:MAG: glutathione S-transferase [Candidatus Puniceispirillaceae bacterium]
MTKLPILWSFRRCPYAMRARLAIKASGIKVCLREILLRDKPAPFLAASPKGTVPVIELPDGTVIDESRDVMFWALGQSDPENWLTCFEQNEQATLSHLDELDDIFKFHLDRYKYATRYAGEDAETHRKKGSAFLQRWDKILSGQPALSGQHLGLLDYATLPFVRQFRIADSDWFDNQDWPHLHAWLQQFLQSAAFADVMTKYAPFKDSHEEHLF